MKPLGSRKPSLYGSISEDFAAPVLATTPAPSWRLTSVPVLAVAFAAALATGGPTYAFGMYSQALKQRLNLTQSALDTLSSANFCAGSISFVPGLLVDHWGIRTAMTLGGVTMCLMFVLYWLIANRLYIKVEDHLVVPVLCLLGVMIFVSNSLIIGSLFKGIVVSTAHGSRGSAVGAAKGFVGIGAGVYAIVFKSLPPRRFFGSNSPSSSDLDFMLLAAVFALFAIAIPAFLLLPGRQVVQNHAIVDVSTPRHYQVIYAGLASLIGLVLWNSSASFMFVRSHFNDASGTTTTIIVQEDDNDDTTTTPQYYYWKALLILLTWLGPIASLFCIKRRQYDPIRVEEDDIENDVNKQQSMADSIDADDDDDDDDDDDSVPLNIIHLKDRNLKQMLHTVPAWLFLWVATIIVGSGTMLTNNMAQMVEARGFSSSTASANCLALFSAAQAITRIAVGEVSERAMLWDTRHFGIESGVPRTFFVVLASFMAVIGHGVLAAATTRPLFVLGVVLSGAAFGSIWPLMVLIVADVFGTMSHGSNYMFYDGFTSAFGTLIISKYIVQSVYESHIDPEVDAITCYGAECFRGAQVIVTGLCVTCLFTSLVLAHITRDSYGNPTRYHFLG